MNLARLVHPDGRPVFVRPDLVVHVGCANEEVAAVTLEGVGPCSVVSWVLPSARDDRLHVGRMELVRGSPDEVVCALWPQLRGTLQ